LISVVMMLWHDPQSRRNDMWVYGAEHVNLLVRQVDRNLTLPHEFVLICDDAPDGLDPRIRTVPLDRTTFIPTTRFAKLMLFRPDAGDIIGKRIFYLDLDTVITGNIDAIVGRKEDIVLWRHPYYRKRRKASAYNTSVILLDAGARPQVWTEFPLGKSAKELDAICNGVRSEDQAWVSKVLGPEEATWGEDSGIYSRRQIKSGLPADARIVTFPGPREPGLPETQAAYPWIKRFRH